MPSKPKQSAVYLTSDERSILSLLADELSIEQVAEKVGYCARTVNRHLSKIYRKLEVKRLHHALIRAERLGLIGGGA